MRTAEVSTETLSILMLEDDPLDSELVEGRLLQAGYAFNAVKAMNRSQFEESFNGTDYDLVLADYNLPDFDGISALEMVRAQDQNLPFIFVSGALGEEVAVESLRRGATDFVLKHRLDRLAPAVSRALKEHHERRSRLKAEALLRESEQLFQLMTNAMPAMVWVSDATGALTYCNHAWTEFTGREHGGFWCTRDTLHVDDVSQTHREWQDALASGKAVDMECRFRRRSDSEYRWHLVRVRPLDAGDPRSAWVGTCIDVHAQKHREDVLRTTEKLAIIGRMAGAIAHEINNPLESMVNLLYLLRDCDTSSEPGKSLLEEADQQLFRISSITKQTLTFYRDKAVLGDIDCRTLIDETVALFRPKLGQKDVDLTVEVDGPVRLQARGGEIRQVLINLVSNAIDAAPPGGRVSIAAQCVTQSHAEYVLLQVSDSGPGIPEHIRKQLFQPFFSTKGTLGTGLGLWVTKNIVESHKGSIDLDSRPAGTVVSVLLPAEYCGDVVEHDRLANAASSEPLPHPMH